MSFFDIVPFRRVPWGLTEFTYSHDQPLADGTLITIRFGGHKTTGVVWRRRGAAPPGITIQPIQKVISDQPWFTPPQQEFFNWVAHDYATPLPTLIYLFGVVPVRRGAALVPSKARDLAKPDKKIKTSSSSWVKKESMLIELGAKADHLAMIKEVVGSWQTKGQFLILCPTAAEVERLSEDLNHAGLSITPYSGQLNRTAQTKIWQSVLNNKSTVIIGTAPAAFLPFSKLDGVMVLNEADPAAKAIESRPLIHLRSVAVRLSDIHKCPLALADNTPSAEATALARAHHWRFIRLGSSLNINDLTLTSSWSAIDHSLVSKISKEINEDKKVLIIAPRAGEGGLLQCVDCQHIFTCPNCGLAYSAPTADKLRCNYCRQVTAVPGQCPKCHGVKLRFKQLTVNYVAKELAKSFNSVTPLVFDANSPVPNHGQKLIVATTAAVYRLTLTDFSLRVVLGFDVFLQQPHWQASHRAFRLLRQLLAAGPTIIQTTSPQHVIFSCAASWEKFIKQELKLRADFGLPPLKTIVKLSVDGNNRHLLLTAAQQAAERLKRDHWQVSSPLMVPGRSPQRQFRYILLIKLPADRQLEKLPALDYSTWTIDPDPVDFT